jgi:hypothetical protein
MRFASIDSLVHSIRLRIVEFQDSLFPTSIDECEEEEEGERERDIIRIHQSRCIRKMSGSNNHSYDLRVFLVTQRHV